MERRTARGYLCLAPSVALTYAVIDFYAAPGSPLPNSFGTFDPLSTVFTRRLLSFQLHGPSLYPDNLGQETSISEFGIEIVQFSLVPEPSSLALAGMAAGFLIFSRRLGRRAVVNAVLACVLLCVAICPAALAVTIDWVRVGNAGNANDSSGYGAVSYSYSIGAYEVTNSQYVEFLNAKDPDGTSPLELYNSDMSYPFYGGIAYNSLAASGSKYSVVSGDGNHPVNFVTFFDTLRFANWLNNGQGTGDTESGAYILQGGTPTPTNADSITRQAGATIFLPSEDEWYKAAYYDPRTTAQGGPPSDGHYWLYPTSSNTAPTASGSTATPNSANYNSVIGNLTNVGAYSGTTSPSARSTWGVTLGNGTRP